MVAEQSETMDGGQQEETAAETKRKREEVLDNAHEEKEDQEVSAKRSKITKEETKEDDDEGPTKDEIGNGNTAEEKPVATNQIDGEKEEATELASSSSPSKGRLKNQKRWRGKS